MLTVTEVLPMRSTRAWKLSRSPIETGCLKTNWLTATVAIRPLAILAGRTAPAMSTWAMIQPPKMSPLPLASAGIGIVRIARWRSSGSCSGAMPDTTARASSSEISGILLSPRSGDLPILSSIPPDPPPMRPAALSTPPPAAASPREAPAPKSDWRTLAKLLPYVWAWRWRVLVALACLVAAKLANIGVPLVLKRLVDALALKPGDPASVLVVPVAILLAYGALRVSITLFTELREFLFYPVAARIARRVSLEAFEHLLALSLRFHLERQTGGVSRDIERGSRSIQSLLNYTIYNILPTLVEITMVIVLLSAKFDAWFAAITFGALVIYIAFTVSVTEWRTAFRRAMNEQDSKANTKALDALLNYETVKYFSNESFEQARYDENLQRLEKASIKSQTSLSLLNLGQSLIIATAVTLLVWRATLGVVAGTMTLGDLVLVNALMIQLYIPLNFLGVIYREIKPSMLDMEKMFALLGQNREIADAPGAPPLVTHGGAVRFEHVRFGYDPDRTILHDISFDIPAGKT